MKFETYKKICGKQKIRPSQVIADGNIREILERDKDHDLKYHETLLDQYFTVHYWEGKVAEI